MPWVEERFTSPGTWTCPPTTLTAEVIVVGGGGGSAPIPVNSGGAGGGGGVVKRIVPVSGPQPVTVGAGGPVGPNSSPYSGGVGGTSYFGPAGPGPIPAIPPTTVAAGGGGGGTGPATPGPIAFPIIDAPSIGGGGGAGYPNRNGLGGLGSPSTPTSGGGMGGSGGRVYATVTGQTNIYGGQASYLGFGAGGNSPSPANPNSRTGTGTVPPSVGIYSNTGNGGSYGQAGSSGIVIVRWWVA